MLKSKYKLNFTVNSGVVHCTHEINTVRPFILKLPRNTNKSLPLTKSTFFGICQKKVLFTGLAKIHRTPFTYFTKNFFQDEKGRTLKWGDEVEYIIVQLDNKVNFCGIS